MNNKSALFLKTKHIGDSIILTASINALPEDYGSVDILCLPESYEIFEGHPRVRNIYTVPRNLFGIAKIIVYYKTLKKMLATQYDTLFQFSDDWRGALLARVLSVKLSVARKPLDRGEIWQKSFNVISNVARQSRPSVEQDIDLLRLANLYHLPVAPPYSIFTSNSLDAEAKKWLTNNLTTSKKGRVILIHACSRWKFKQLPSTTWAVVIDLLHQYGFNVILTGSELDSEFNYSIARLTNKRTAIHSSESIKSTAALYKHSDILISIDSMSLHLASAVNLPVIAIFGPTNELNWAPWKVQHKIVSLNKDDEPSFACRPCGIDGCGGSKISNCLVFIKPEDIVSKALAFLKSLN